MTPQWRKYIARHPQKNKLLEIIMRIQSEDFAGLDLKKLKGFENLYRVRHGSIRIIFMKKDDENYIVAVDTR